MIELKKVKKIYDNIIALNDISLQLPNKGLIIILGDKGSGKTTLLNVIGGLSIPSYGNLYVNGNNVTQFNKKKLSCYRANIVGLFNNDIDLIDDYNVYDNIALVLKIQKKGIYYPTINTMLERLDLKGFGLRKISELDNAQKQKILIGRLLIKKSKIILADDPTFNLSENSTTDIMNLLKEESKDKLVVMTTTDINLARKYANRVIILNDGKIIKDTDPIEIVDIDYHLELRETKLLFLDRLKTMLYFIKSNLKMNLFVLLIFSLVMISLGIISITNDFNKQKFETELIKLVDDKNIYFNKSKNSNIAFETNEIVNLNNLFETELNQSYSENNLLFKSLNLSNSPIYESIYYSYMDKQLNIIELSSGNSIISDPIMGRMPSLDNEIVISNFIADYIINFGIEEESKELYRPYTYQEILNDDYNYNLGKLKNIRIVGIINYDLTDIEKFKNEINLDNYKASEKPKIMEYLDNIISNKLSLIYVKKGFIQNLDNNLMPTRLYLNTNHDLYKNFKIYNENNNIKLNSIYSDSFIQIKDNNNYINRMSIILFVFTFTLGMITLIMLLNKTVKNNYQKIKTFLMLGITKGDIIKIYTYQIVFINIFVLLLSLIFIYISKPYVNQYLIYNIYNNNIFSNRNYLNLTLTNHIILILFLSIITACYSLLCIIKIKNIRETN